MLRALAVNYQLPRFSGAVTSWSLLRHCASSHVTESDHKRTAHSHDSHSTVDSKEVEKFAALSSEWWNPTGSFAGLRALNEARVPFIAAAGAAAAGQARDPQKIFSPDALQGLKLLDVGCGGGILAEPLARLGAQVTGIDITPENIVVAQKHMQLDSSLQSRLRYQEIDAQELVKDHAGKFDVVVSSEVIEHVLQPAVFVSTLCKLCSPGGVVVITTLNRTPRSYAEAIVAAEHVLGMVPAGTHDWNMFVTPEELAIMFQRAGMEMTLLSGMRFKPMSKRWQLTSDYSVNYAAAFQYVGAGQ